MYAAVLIPLALEGPFHYIVPPELMPLAAVGMRVLVPFGSKRSYIGVITKIQAEMPYGGQKLKTIQELPDERPLLGTADLAFIDWMSSYYLCTRGEVLRAAMPAALLPESKTMVHLTPDCEITTQLSHPDSVLLDLLASCQGKPISMGELQRKMGRMAIPSFTRLVEIGAIRLSEEVLPTFKPRTKRFLRLAEAYQTDETLTDLLDNISRAKKQCELLLDFAEYTAEHTQGLAAAIPYEELSKQDSKRVAAIMALRRRNVLIVENIEESRLGESDTLKASPPLPLSGERLELNSVVSVFYDQNISAKEAAIEVLINETLLAGGQVLLLSTETTRTSPSTSLLARLKARHPDAFLTYTSSTNTPLRVETFRKVANSTEPLLVVGLRAAVFLPFRRLSLVIIDEEQEYGYKQQQPAPRFHARDAAIYMANLRGAKVVLTSESPSAETLFNIAIGKWKRVGPAAIQAPLQILKDLEIVDTSELRKQRRMKSGELISPQLQEAIQEQLDERRTILVIQNRRGYAPYLVCNNCGSKIRCPQCDVSLTYYKRFGQLRCNYCQHTTSVPHVCPSCRVNDASTLVSVGFGSERAEEELVKLFPEARIIRIDADVATSRKRMLEIQMRLENNDVDIIIGTQMIKGQPVWENLGLIAIPRLDTILAFPDFRSDERAYQLLFQIALRSNLPNSRPRLIIQTADPEQPFIKSLQAGRYDSFIANQLGQRQFFGWPPFRRLTTVIVKARDESLVEHTAHRYHALLLKYLGEDLVSLVSTPSVSRINLSYIRHISLKRPVNTNPNTERTAILSALEELYQQYPLAKRARIIFDVDPL